ncbi:MAG: DUF2505 domain-containing protein [Actinomycetota bacterium]|nr:DUF2505 domain-containing protein [Actinomycetota bacterium]
MKVVSTHTYAAAPDVVFAMMTTPDVLSAKYAALGHHDVVILEHQVDDDGKVAVRSRRSVPMEVPGFAKRILSPTNTVEQRDRWNPAGADGVRIGTWEVNARGVPVTVGGTLRLAPGPRGTTVVEIAGEVKCSVPLLGGKLASFVGDDVQRTLLAEEAFNDGHLAATPKTTRSARGTRTPPKE